MNAARPRGARNAALAAWILLGGVVTAWILALESAAAMLAAALFVLGPLLLPARGLWASDRRTLRWAPFTLTPALGWALTEVIANPLMRLPAALTLLAVLLALAAAIAQLRTVPQS